MKIKAIHHKAVPIKSKIRNAAIDFSQMTVSAVAIETDVMRGSNPVIGYGFSSNGRYAQDGILNERMIPRLLAAKPKELLDESGENINPFKAWQVMMANEKPGGHGERCVAVGVIDMALWDIAAKIEGKPLYRLLSERYNQGQKQESVWVYAAGGYYYPGKDIQQLKDEMKSYLDLGYDCVKLKVGGASLKKDLSRIEAVIDVVGEGKRVAIDANGRFDIQQGLAYVKAIEPYGLKWFEEVGDPLDYLLNHTICQVSTTPIATGENLFSMTDVRNLIRYGGMHATRDWIQVDPVLGYGLVEYCRILEMMKGYGWSPSRCIPHGGHQFALHLAAGLCLGGNESYPHVFRPFGGFGDDVPIECGYVKMPDVPGIGFELKSDLMDILCALTK